MSNKIRTEMRHKRRQLSAPAQTLAADQLLGVVSRLREFQFAHRIGIYLAHGGEIDPAPIKHLAEMAGKICHLPVLHPLKDNSLHFVRHQYGDTLKANRFGIPEPELRQHRMVSAWSLQIIFVPLVAFDSAGNRLGMGGGFYDRSLAFTRNRPGSSPLLIGLAHSFQQVDHLEASPWDIPLHGIATEQEFIPIKKISAKTALIKTAPIKTSPS